MIHRGGVFTANDNSHVLLGRGAKILNKEIFGNQKAAPRRSFITKDIAERDLMKAKNRKRVGAFSGTKRTHVERLTRESKIGQELLRLCKDKDNEVNTDKNNGHIALKEVMNILNCDIKPGNTSLLFCNANLPKVVPKVALMNEVVKTYDYSRLASDKGTTLLMFACYYGNLELANILVEMYYTDDPLFTVYDYINTPNQYDGRTALHQAAHSGDKRLVDYLLRLDAKRDAKDGEGLTPYDVAVDEGHDEEFLVKLEPHELKISRIRTEDAEMSSSSTPAQAVSTEDEKKDEIAGIVRHELNIAVDALEETLARDSTVTSLHLPTIDNHIDEAVLSRLRSLISKSNFNYAQRVREEAAKTFNRRIRDYKIRMFLFALVLLGVFLSSQHKACSSDPLKTNNVGGIFKILSNV